MLLRSILAAVFVLFAVVQWNDPDPLAWIALYLGTAVLLVVSIWKKLPKWIYFSALSIVVIWTLALLPDFIHWIQIGMPNITSEMKTEEPHIEFTREFLGLFIVGITIAFLAKR